MLISEVELRAALEPLLDRLLAERLRYFQLQLEPRLQSMIAAALEPAGAGDVAAEWKALAEARGPEECFAALYEQLGRALGARRALVVRWEDAYAVWRQQGTELPERFPAPGGDLVLRAGEVRRLLVRGREIGLIYWKGHELDARARMRLELLARTAELALLSWALPPVSVTSGVIAAGDEHHQAAALLRSGGATQGDFAQSAKSAESQFAQLLIEDLAIYLERECPLELAAAVAQGTWRERFAPEIERCRHAFRERYPGADPQLIEEALPRLGAV